MNFGLGWLQKRGLLLLFFFLELSQVLFSLPLLLGLFIFDSLDADFLDLELDPPQLDDVMFKKLVVKLLLALLNTAYHKVHALGHLGGQLVVVNGHGLLILRLILRLQVVTLGHLWGIQKVLV